MKKIFNKKNIVFLIFFIFYGIIFFNYNIILTYDTSEYFGMASFIGKSDMVQNWIGHRGIAFPLLLKIFSILGSVTLKIMLYVFYILMIIGVYKIFKETQKYNLFFNKLSYIILILLVIIFIILNPIIFGYYHVILTEFVAITTIIISIYFAMKWLNIDLKNNKKQAVKYLIIFSCISIFIYHIKQSLIPYMLVLLIISSLISIIDNFKLYNILTRIGTILIVFILLIITVCIWNFAMSGAKVSEKTNEMRIKNKLILGVSSFEKVCDEENVDEINLEKLPISLEDKKEIDNILEGNSIYKKFTIYKNMNDKYFVYYTKEDYSFKEQLGFYFKILFTCPNDVIFSYYNGYKKILYFVDGWPINMFKENLSIGTRIYRTKSNIIDINKKYEQYVEEYKVDKIEENVLTKNFNKIELKLNSFITVIIKYNLLILPILLIILFILYIIIKEKIGTDNKKILQFIIIIYTTCFGIIMPYVMLHHLVDRYIVPAIVPMFIADIMLVLLVMKLACTNICKKKS